MHIQEKLKLFDVLEVNRHEDSFRSMTFKMEENLICPAGTFSPRALKNFAKALRIPKDFFGNTSDDTLNSVIKERMIYKEIDKFRFFLHEGVPSDSPLIVTLAPDFYPHLNPAKLFEGQEGEVYRFDGDPIDSDLFRITTVFDEINICGEHMNLGASLFFDPDCYSKPFFAELLWRQVCQNGLVAPVESSFYSIPVKDVTDTVTCGAINELGKQVSVFRDRMENFLTEATQTLLDPPPEAVIDHMEHSGFIPKAVVKHCRMDLEKARAGVADLSEAGISSMPASVWDYTNLITHAAKRQEKLSARSKAELGAYKWAQEVMVPSVLGCASN